MNIPTGFAQVNIIFSGLAAPRGSQVTLGLGGDGISGSPATIAAQVGTAYAAEMLPDHPATLTLDSVRCKKGPNDTGPDGSYSFGTPGGDSAVATEPQVAMLVRKNTLLGGRVNKGRMFIPAIADVGPGSNGVLSGPTVTLWQDNVDDFYAALVAVNLIPYILHNDEEVAPTPIVSFTVLPLVATQRRRLRKVGGRRRSILI